VIAAAFSAFSKPVKRLEGTISCGGTRPTRDAGGKTGPAASAAWTDRIRPRAATRKPLTGNPLQDVPDCSGTGLKRLARPAQGQMEAPALGQQVGGPGREPVDSMIDQAGRAAEHDRIARAQPDRARRGLPVGSAVAEQGGLAEGQGHDGCLELLLVP